MKDTVLSVSQLNEYVRLTLATDPVLHGIELVGEVSNFKSYPSGHWYFTLKDEDAAISCVMFRQNNLAVPFHPENGEQIRLKGSVSLYSKTGTYQFYADAMIREGTGELYLRFEQLKRKLLEEGLFDQARKKPLPSLPKGIGIITSRTGAVVHDIARVAWHRFPGMPLYLCSVKVQGEGAACEIADGIRRMAHFPQVDLLIVGRGGGSMEDLWPFNEEVVARAIYSCKKPVISAVGHETDFTIADFTADVRAATPSNAAEIAVPLKEALLEDIGQIKSSMDDSWSFYIRNRRNQLELLLQRLKAQTPLHRQEQMREKLRAAQKRLQTAYSMALNKKKNQLDSIFQQLEIASPQATLKRGYAIVSIDGRAARSAAELNRGMSVSVRFSSGSADMTVNDIHLENGIGEEDVLR